MAVWWTWKPEMQSVGKFLSKMVSDGFEFGLQKCVNQSGTVTCYFKVTNTEDDKEISIYPSRCRLFDTEGNIYQGYKAVIANKSATGNNDPRIRLVKDIPVNASVSFPGAANDTDAAALVEIIGNYEKIHLQFRDVDFSKE